MSSTEMNVRVKTLRGGRIKDIENCLIEYISNGSLKNTDIIALHVGTNNVSDGDSVNNIISDYENVIGTI